MRHCKRGRGAYTYNTRRKARGYSRRRRSNPGYELFYSSGGHGGRYRTLREASAAAKSRVLPQERWIEIRKETSASMDKWPVKKVVRYKEGSKPRETSGADAEIRRWYGYGRREALGGNPRRRYEKRGVGGRYLQVPEQHQLRIARDTLRMSDVGARIMGGMTKAEARAVIARLTGRRARGNPGGGINDVRPGDIVKFLAYAGIGRDGPEYKPRQGRVYLRGTHGWVVAQKGRSASPNVVDEKNFLGIVRHGR